MTEAAIKIVRDAPRAEPDAQTATIDAHQSPAFSDEQLALRFASRHAAELRYVAAWSKWLWWDGLRWQTDDTMLSFGKARAVCREAANECNKGKIAVGIASAKTVAAVERLAKADRRLAATTSQWDADPWSLNTPNGVIDLKTGEISEHQPHDYFTKLTAVGPADGGCPTWQGFLNIVTANDLELQHFMQRLECFVVLWSAFSPFVRFCPVMKRLPILSDSGTDFDRTVDDLLGVCG
jgi:phage/plasmid-associated DNA primase